MRPDEGWERDVAAAQDRCCREMLTVLRQYAAEPDMRRAMGIYNVAAPLARQKRDNAVAAAQRLRMTRAAPRCEVCGEAMTVIGAGQTTHPMCEPPDDEEPGW